MRLFDWHRRPGAICIGVALLAIAAGCKSDLGRASRDKVTDPRTEIREVNKFDPTGASLCLQQMFKNPPGAFHASFLEKTAERDTSSIEVDVTSTAIDYTKTDINAGQNSTSTKHLALAQMSEMELDFDVMGPVPWHGELVAAQNATKPTGNESVNGYSTQKFEIDTANEPAAQKATFDSLMAVKDYKIIGHVWITSDAGCLVKYIVDFEQDKKDGSIQKKHFEGNVTKK